LGVVVSVLGTFFDIGVYIGVVGDNGDFTEKFEVRDLFNVVLCGLSREVLRSDGIFCKLPILFE
jgi:hypothetical protein